MDTTDKFLCTIKIDIDISIFFDNTSFYTFFKYLRSFLQELHNVFFSLSEFLP